MGLLADLKKMLAFLKRDFLINSSYKMSFVLEFGAIIFSLTTFFFVSKLFGKNVSAYLADYGGDYFPFILIGIAFYGYLATAMSSFTQAIQQEQDTGTLEAIMLSPTRISTMLIGGSLWSFLFTSVSIFLYIFLGILFFGFPAGNINIPAAAIMLILTTVSFSSLGIMSASFILVLKKGDPVNTFFDGLSRLLGGVYFPVTILPLWAQKLSCLLPITYSLHGMRMAMLMGGSIRDVWQDIVALIVFSAIFLPFSIICFKFAVRKAKADGSLLYC